MSLAEEMQYYSDLAEQQVAGITTVTAIVPLQDLISQLASGGTNDFIGPVANHIYYIKKLFIYEAQAITGVANIQIYNQDAVQTTVYTVNLNPGEPFVLEQFFTTRMRHLLAGGSAGDYMVLFTGFDITYT